MRSASKESGLVRGDALGCWKTGDAMPARALLERRRQELTLMIRWRQMRTGCKNAPNQAVQATPNDAFSSAVADGAFWLGVPELWTLIWLKIVKRVNGLLSESFHSSVLSSPRVI